jgi:hypothetical protein
MFVAITLAASGSQSAESQGNIQKTKEQAELVRHDKSTVWTVDIPSDKLAPGPVGRASFVPAYDVALISFGDDGTCDAESQVRAARDCINSARSKNPNGAVVILFIHGWHHSSAWEDTHFVAFREILKRLALRECERSSSRNVVGIYMSWNGDPKHPGVLQRGWFTHTTFWDRYAVASKVGKGADIRDTVRKIIFATKNTAAGQEPSQLVMVGHSMGALVLESVFLSMLMEADSTLDLPVSSRDAKAVQTYKNTTAVAFPDLLLAVNSAADSEILRKISEQLRKQNITKRASGDGMAYSPPLLISVTSSADSDTGRLWRIARFGGSTDGHDKSLLTHTFRLTDQLVHCRPRNEVDFGQSWHCLRRPNPSDVASPEFAIDLPARERHGRDDRNVEHIRYLLTPIGDRAVARPVWVFQLPPQIVADHNDIFDYRSNTLLLPLMQISGAVMSLARGWQDSFE